MKLYTIIEDDCIEYFICIYIYMHITVNSDGKIPIKAWNNFLWFIVEHHWKGKVYSI